MNSPLIDCLFHCGQKITEDGLLRHLNSKCRYKLKYIYCPDNYYVYPNDSSELNEHIGLCRKCKMKKVDIDIANQNTILALQMNKTKSIGGKGVIGGGGVDDTMMNMEVPKKNRGMDGINLNNTMIQGMENDSQKMKKRGSWKKGNVDREQIIDDSFAGYNEENTIIEQRYNSKIIREDDDDNNEDDDAENLDDYFINSDKKNNPKASEKKKDKDKNDSDDLAEYFS